jgi:translation initiation factor 5B
MRDKKSAFKSVKSVVAATGVKLGCPDLEGVLSGMPIVSCEKNEESIEKAKLAVQAEINEVKVETDAHGVIIKADNIGSLEALSVLLKEKGVKIRKASVGEISKKDVTEAESNYEQDPLTAIIIGFNIAAVESNEHIKIITNTVIYRLIEEYELWLEETEKELSKKKLEGLIRPGKIQILKNCIFRQSNPCVAGAEVLSGKINTGTNLMKANGNKLTIVKEMQVNRKNVHEIKKGEQAAISLPHITGGRQLNEEDILYTEIPPPDFRELRKHSNLLDPEEIELLKEIAEIKRKEDPFWGK